jgi:predicted ribosome quality control (RQC) complex YloA/Tae2 family protein
VRRPKGAKPGMVIYFHQKTVLVKPDAQKVERMRA